MRALIVVDIQHDFMPGGALAVPDGDKAIAVANAVMPVYEVVVLTQDWHPARHRSFAAEHPGRQVGEVIEVGGVQQVLWPVHCVQETRGAAFPAELHTGRVTEVFRKGMDPEVDSYSGFFDNGRRHATGLGEWLRGRGVSEVDVLGVALDYCVKFTALDAAELGFRTRLILDGCRAVELAPGDAARAVEQMQAAGIEVVDSAVVLAGARAAR